MNPPSPRLLNRTRMELAHFSRTSDLSDRQSADLAPIREVSVHPSTGKDFLTHFGTHGLSIMSNRHCIVSPYSHRTCSVSCPVLLSKMGAMRHQKSVGREVEPLYCKVYASLPHGTSRLSRFRFGPSVRTPFLCRCGSGALA